MTTGYRCPQPAIRRKRVDNLTQIGRHDRVADPQRHVCANAAARWEGCLEEVEAAIGEGLDGEDDDARGTAADDTVPGQATIH